MRQGQEKLLLVALAMVASMRLDIKLAPAIQEVQVNVDSLTTVAHANDSNTSQQQQKTQAKGINDHRSTSMKNRSSSVDSGIRKDYAAGLLYCWCYDDYKESIAGYGSWCKCVASCAITNCQGCTYNGQPPTGCRTRITSFKDGIDEAQESRSLSSWRKLYMRNATGEERTVINGIGEVQHPRSWSHASGPRTMAELSNFFALEDARATMVTDLKFDDALCLWIFYLLNLDRPATHRVEIVIYVIGLKDIAAAACLAQDLFEKACAYFQRTRKAFPNPRISLRVLTPSVDSQGFSPTKPKAERHELYTYAPYRQGVQGFPQADKMPEMKYWGDIPVEELKSDFVGVIAQYFVREVETEDAEDGMNLQKLDYLVPREGGVLAFQVGFNTEMGVNMDKQEHLWATLTTKIKQAGASMVLINNDVSFVKENGKPPGKVKANSKLLQELQQSESSQLLWKHLVESAVKEDFLFACDQMAKWLTNTVKKIDTTQKDGLNQEITALAQEREITADLEGPDAADAVSSQLRHQFLSKGPFVMETHRRLKDLVVSNYDPERNRPAKYLSTRVLPVFQNYGNPEEEEVEVTDGRHFAVLFLAEEPVLKPVRLEKGQYFMNQLFDNIEGESVIWAAQGVSVTASVDFMMRGINPVRH